MGGAMADSGGHASALDTPSAVFDDFASFAANAIAPMSIETSDRHRFHARYRRHDLARTSFVDLDIGDLHVYHAPDKGGLHTFQVLHAIETPMDIVTPQGRFVLPEGDICLLDNAEHYSVTIPGRHRAIDFIVPADWLRRWIGDMHAVKARPISLRSGWGPPLASFLQTICTEIDAGDVPTRVIEQNLGGLLNMSLRGIEHACGIPTGQALLGRRAIEAIRARHEDPELTCDTVAAEVGVAPRTLQKALASCSTTYRLALTEIRMERARAMLADPACAGLGIAEIAYRAGYADSGYFTRVFTRTMGSPPSHWRANRQAHTKSSLPR